MKRVIAVYGSPETRWEDALRWAKDNGYTAKTIRERCYKALNHKAAMYYANEPDIIRDYTMKGTPRLTDEALDGND